MAFESLSFRYNFNIEEFPSRWLPLIYLYDPDLPLFPIYYFHVLTNRDIVRPSDTDRIFGYIERINLVNESEINVTCVLNKDLSNPHNDLLIPLVRDEVMERLGIIVPVTINDINSTFDDNHQNLNRALFEVWHRVVTNAYGNKLPFGRLWDDVFGLVRFVASWNSPAGRKSELIETHYFVSHFGVPIQSGAGIPQVDFYLLPTIDEILDLDNPLTSFPLFCDLADLATHFQINNCQLRDVEDLKLSKFNNPFAGSMSGEQLLSIFNGAPISYKLKKAGYECFNAFDKGPQRPVIFLLMLDDLRKGRLDPRVLNSLQCGSIYDGMKATYQSPKVIALYAQQCFGNIETMPIDTWVDTFLKWPLNILPHRKINGKYYGIIFELSQKLGKVERLIWVASQARKVHSSACNDILWCMKYGGDDKPRGANPFSCNICLDAMRRNCPAYDAIAEFLISFNTGSPGARFKITTEAHNNQDHGQKFLECKGNGLYGETVDTFSPADEPDGFEPYPNPNHHNGELITVSRFIELY